VAQRAIPGVLRIGRGSADRSLFLFTWFCRRPGRTADRLTHPNLRSPDISGGMRRIVSGTPGATLPMVCHHRFAPLAVENSVAA
jgi:hypothetical protein